MPATPPIPQKTPLGVEAQRKRTADLGQRHRTILFLVDGKRTLSEVIGLAIQAGAAAHHFEDLVRLGYIEVPQPEPPSRPMPLDETDAIAESLEIDVPAAPPPEPLLLGEEAVVSRFGPAESAPAPAPEPELPPVSAPVPLAPAAAVRAPPPAPTRPIAVGRAAVAPAVPAPTPPAPPVLAVPAVKPRPAPAAAPAPVARPVVAKPVPPPPPTPQPKPAKVRAPTIISSHGLAPVDKATVATTRTLRVIPPATHDDDDMLDEVRACLLETVRLDGAAFGKRMAARVRQAAESSDFIGLVWELERETSHSRRSREGLWNLQRARELLGLGNTLVAEDSKPNWPDSE
jgi:hypothetical protein